MLFAWFASRRFPSEGDSELPGRLRIARRPWFTSAGDIHSAQPDLAIRDARARIADRAVNRDQYGDFTERFTRIMSISSSHEIRIRRSARGSGVCGIGQRQSHEASRHLVLPVHARATGISRQHSLKIRASPDSPSPRAAATECAPFRTPSKRHRARRRR